MAFHLWIIYTAKDKEYICINLCVSRVSDTGRSLYRHCNKYRHTGVREAALLTALKQLFENVFNDEH
jgi:hypothetical protein